MAKLHRVVLYLTQIDEDEPCQIETLNDELENSRYLFARVGETNTVDLGEWDDELPVNKTATPNSYFENLFAKT